MSRDAAKSPRSWRLAAVGGALCLITLAVYSPVKSHEFVNFDDGTYILGNAQVRGGLTWAGVLWAFTTGSGANWHPLTWLSHMLDWQLYGQNAGAHLLTNVAFHLANTFLLLTVLYRMTGALWRSAWVAGLFALHPMHVESVAWVAERKDVLSTFFWLLTLLAYLKYVQGPMSKVQSPPSAGRGVRNAEYQPGVRERWIFYALALVCFALGLMSKPMLVTLPFVLLLLDYWPLGRFAAVAARTDAKQKRDAKLPEQIQPISWKRLLLEKAPFLLLAVISSVVTYLVQQHGGAVRTLGERALSARVANAVVSYLRYVGKLCWPENLSYFYAYPKSWPGLLVLAAGVFLAGVSAWVVLGRKRRPYMFTGWFWFVGTLVPVIGLVQVGAQSMADRYTYVPGIGLFIMAAWGVPELLARWPQHRWLLGAGAAASLAACATLASAQVGYWQDSAALFDHAVKATPDNYIAQNNLAVILIHQGKLDAAIGHLNDAIASAPGDPGAYLNLGNALAMQNKLVEAGRQYSNALAREPDNESTRINLAILLRREGKLDGAITHLNEAVRLAPADSDAHVILAETLASQKDFPRAVQEFEAALRLKPDMAEAENGLGNALAALGKPEEAAKHYLFALKLNPADPAAHYNLGMAYLRLNQSAQALAEFREAVRLRPDFREALQQIATLTGH